MAEILREDWDPIGIRDVPAASDEYDDYAPGLAAKLLSGASLQELTEALLRIETESIGLEGDRARAAEIAAKLTMLSQS
ncbi:hypothetical protein V6C03_00805 [Methyloligella sp. 2.7D]|uniref:hypothetical protein n=1 Tax=unclassified Methyloligella TaxID=2625955 RepID=UPI00157CA701|nr:hypothetical protein [Methyloligella sp. GL2]QKP76792.1 hypothetical protein HT051_04610 [Methyloligella sp. GL2]